MLKTRVLSSMHKVFPNSCSETEVASISGAQNEAISFQVAFRIEDTENKSELINVRSECALPLSTYLVGYVPVRHTDTPHLSDLPAPGLFGDTLLEKATNPELVFEGAPWGKRYYEKGEETLVNAANDAWQSMFFTVNEFGTEVEPGEYPVRIVFENGAREIVGVSETVIRIIPEKLEKQTLQYTNWLHCDCIADFYSVEIFSDRFFEILEDFVEKAARNGMNMVLTPAFTPPLDTPIDSERRTAQLVRVTVQNGQYAFDFSLMKRFVDVCRRVGIEYFEHSHLFSQWGAIAAPKIMAEVDGKETRLFGWDTDAGGDAYRKFLRAYLTALKAFLKENNMEEKILFHISDEPNAENETTYCRALNAVGNLLDGYRIGDALSEYLFYEKGMVQTPICVTSAIHTFVGRCNHLWAYYTGGQLENGLSNRVIVMPHERNRMLGIQMYYYGIEGFLHWGYNYYYDLLSHGLYDPNANPCGYGNHAGTCYFVYPGHNGRAIQSVRQKIFFEGIQDMRALQTLEKKQGRAACEEIIQKHFGDLTFYTAPESPEKLLAFREDVNAALS